MKMGQNGVLGIHEGNVNESNHLFYKCAEYCIRQVKQYPIIQNFNTLKADILNDMQQGNCIEIIGNKLLRSIPRLKTVFCKILNGRFN